MQTNIKLPSLDKNPYFKNRNWIYEEMSRAETQGTSPTVDKLYKLNNLGRLSTSAGTPGNDSIRNIHALINPSLPLPPPSTGKYGLPHNLPPLDSLPVDLSEVKGVEIKNVDSIKNILQKLKEDNCESIKSIKDENFLQPLNAERLSKMTNMFDSMGRPTLEGSFTSNIKNAGIIGTRGSVNIGNETPNENMDNISEKRGNNISLEEAKIFKYLNIDLNDSMSFHDGFVPMLYNFARISNLGPISWLSSILKDPMIRPIRDQIIKQKKESLFKATNETENHYEDRFFKYLGVDDIIPLNVNMHNPELNPYFVEETDLNFKVFTKPQKCNIPELMKDILKVLPSKKILWLYIKRFFERSYPIHPYVDEHIFTNEVQILLYTDQATDINSDEKFEKLNINNRLNFATLGTMLLVLKLSELSLASYSSNPEKIERSSEEELLLRNPLDSEIPAVSQKCLSLFKLLNRCALPVFQLALLTKEYENVDGLADGSNNDSHIFISILVQMGINIGLNRDPEHFDVLISKGRIGHLWRKIWYRLLALDTQQYILFGTNKVVDYDFFDTHLPYFEESSSNNKNFEIEKIIIEKIKLQYKFNTLANELTSYVCNLKCKSKVQVILSKLWKIEKQLEENFGNLKDILGMKIDTIEQQTAKFWDFSIYVQISGFLTCIYHNLYLYFQKNSNAEGALFCIQKGILLWMYILSNFEFMSCKCSQYFGMGFESAIAEVILPSLHKGWVFYLSPYICVLLYIEKYENKNIENSGHEAKIKILHRFCKQIKESGLEYLPSLKSLANKNFYSWKLLKAHAFIISLIRDKKFIFLPMLCLKNFVESINESDAINLVKLTTCDNYRYGSKESNSFKILREKLHQNVPADENSPSYTSDSYDNHSLTNDIHINQQSMDVFSTLSQEDVFWRDVFMSNELNKEKSMSAFDSMNGTPKVDSRTVLPFESSTNQNEKTSPYTQDPEKYAGLFIDQTIYDMFN